MFIPHNHSAMEAMIHQIRGELDDLRREVTQGEQRLQEREQAEAALRRDLDRLAATVAYQARGDDPNKPTTPKHREAEKYLPESPWKGEKGSTPFQEFAETIENYLCVLMPGMDARDLLDRIGRMAGLPDGLQHTANMPHLYPRRPRCPNGDHH